MVDIRLKECLRDRIGYFDAFGFVSKKAKLAGLFTDKIVKK
jgi:hypothetical protein